jgi:hypothetical protein
MKSVGDLGEFHHGRDGLYVWYYGGSPGEDLDAAGRCVRPKG